MCVFERWRACGYQTSRMKINNLFRALCVAGSLGALSLLTRADDAAAAAADHQKLKTYSGIIESQDAKDRTVTVKGLLFRKTFHAGESCRVLDPQGKAAELSDLRAGQKVKVDYRDAHGVFVAESIARERMAYTERKSGV